MGGNTKLLLLFFFFGAQREEICVLGGFYKGVERIALLFRFQAQSVFDRLSENRSVKLK